MIVLDASAVVEWLLNLPLAAEVCRRIDDPERSLHAPHLLPVEVAQVLRRHVRIGAVDAQRGAAALADLADLDLTGHDCVPLLPRMWQLRENASAYDAAYLALAEVLDAPLVTLDARLARSPGHRACVDLIGGTAGAGAAG